MNRRIKEERKGKPYNPRGKGRNAIWAVLYYVYPRPMDFAKVLYIVLGIALGGAISGALTNDPGTLVVRGLTALLVFDGLVYQTRYQWNDVRGATEDDNNPESDKRARLPKDIVGLHSAVLLSVLFGLFKLALAVEIIVAFGSQLGVCFTISCVLVFVLGIMYERARALDCVPAVVFLVTLGYPLRVIAGMSVGLAVANVALFNVSASMLAVVLIAAATFGLSFVGITWALEGCAYMRSHAGPRPLKPYKSHVMWMYRQVGSASGELYPLRPCGRVITAWNVGIALSVLLMCAYAMYSTRASHAVAIVCLLWLGVLVYGIASNGTRTIGLVLTALVMAALLAALFSGNASLLGGATETVMLFTVGAYLLVYQSFRMMNYTEMTSVLKNLVGAFPDVAGRLEVLLLGRETAAALEAKRPTKR